MTFCAVIAGVFLTYWGLPMPVGIVAAIAAGALCGSVSGTLIAKMKIPPFIATLGMMMLLKGLALVISGTKPIYFNDTPNFPMISQDSLIGSCAARACRFPTAVLILFVVAIVVQPRAQRARRSAATPSRSASNEEAVRLSGVNIDFWKIIVYTVARRRSAALPACMIASRLNSAQPALGQGYELDAIAAVVIGGTSLERRHAAPSSARSSAP